MGEWVKGFDLSNPKVKVMKEKRTTKPFNQSTIQPINH